MRNVRPTYIAIDLKSFYASVECVERGLDPMNTNLVVADPERTEKTICLAVSPALKSFGVPGRPRLFEVIQAVNEINIHRRFCAPGQELKGTSVFLDELSQNPSLALEYLVAPPQMQHYMETSTCIYEIYLKYVAPEDIHVYSIDEVFIDVTTYIGDGPEEARDFAMKMIREVYHTTGITATVGIGTNLYLAKIAMDIVAKHMDPDADGVRIARIDEISYRKLLWDHRPLTDFWRIGHGYARKLEDIGLYTMGDIARCSIGTEKDYYNEELLYKLFGIAAELLIDHAWGYESCTMQDIKNYRASSTSVSSGQVLPCAYDWDKGRLVVWEMADLLALDLLGKGLETNQMVLDIHFEKEHPHAHGSVNLSGWTASSSMICEAVLSIFDQKVDRKAEIRRINVCAARVRLQKKDEEQLNLFEEIDAADPEKRKEKEKLERERKIMMAMLQIKDKYGKNAILKGSNLQEGATTMIRNEQVGGHRK